MKRIVRLFLGLVFAFSLISSAAWAEEIEFSGSRTLICSFDRSDLNNFIDGGSKSFEKVLKSLNLNNCEIETEKIDRELCVTISFPFNSLDEYEACMQEFLGYKPVIVYETDDDFIFAENFDSSEMLNFAETELINQDMLKELKFDRLLKVNTCSITINGNTYDTTDNFDVRDSDSVKFDRIDIITTGNDDGTFERVIKARIYGSNCTKTAMNTVKTYFDMAGAGAYSGGSGGTDFMAEVVIDAVNQYDLSKKTLIACGVTVRTIEKEIPQDNYVLVDCTEKIGVKKVLNEGGSYNYEFTFPEYYRNLQDVPPMNLLSGRNKLMYSGDEGIIKYRYHRGLKISSLTIITDLSDIMGNIVREITFTVPEETADLFDSDIMSALRDVQSMYPEASTYSENTGNDRLYILRIETRNPDIVSEITQETLNGESWIEYDTGFLPFKENRIAETIEVGEIIEDMIPVSQMETVYLLAEDSQIASSNASEYTYFDNIYSVLTGREADIEVTYTTMSVAFVGVVGAIGGLILIIVVIVLVIVLRGKKSRQSRPSKNDSYSNSYRGGNSGTFL